MNPKLASSLVSASGGVLGNLLGFGSQSNANATNLKINQMNNEFNEKMLDKQLAYNTEMWNKTNEYNSASSQVQRYKDAGLNPYLMMTGGANAGTASNVSGGTASAASSAQMQGFTPDMSFTQDISSMIYNQRKMDADVANTTADATQKSIQNLVLFDKEIAELDLLRKKTRNQKLQNQFQLTQNAIAAFKENTMVDEYFRNVRQQELTMRGISLDNYKKAFENKNLPTIFVFDVCNKLADLEYKNALTDKTINEAIESSERAYGLKFDNKLKDECRDALKDEMINRKYHNNPVPLIQGIFDRDGRYAGDYTDSITGEKYLILGDRHPINRKLRSNSPLTRGRRKKIFTFDFD